MRTLKPCKGGKFFPDPTSRGRPCVQRQTLRPEGDPASRETLRQEADPTSRETQRPEKDPTSRGRPKADFEVPLIFPLKPCVRRFCDIALSVSVTFQPVKSPKCLFRWSSTDRAR
ncbi:hypothetical protein PoB_000274000 [Plakobranchus ocellatus]|uniref:Uncharacterized protein n=1 Tax=Plakobranchus ocellatus TaxID=259542 RepID=A0AAV3XZH0_9GAST|nr:hypothetical protein PoB_000274000 [Plakobranchus ocellatus]